MYTNQEIEKMLTTIGVIKEGHFRRVSGRHANKYVQCARLFEHSNIAETMCRLLVEQLSSYSFDVVMSPAIGGVILGYEVSRQLKIRNIYPERKNGALVLARGFTLKKGEKVLILEDEITTGTSVRETIELVNACGGEVVCIGCLVDKSNGKAVFDHPYHPLVRTTVDNYSTNHCPLCEKNIAFDN